MLCPSCGKKTSGRFGELCPACEAWIKTRHLPDVGVEPEENLNGPTRIIFGFVARNTHRLRQAWKFFDGLRWQS